MVQQLPTQSRHEPNPWRPDLPESIQGLSPQLYDFLREVAETLREQHNLAQAGDSTFSWEVLTVLESQPRYTLGSLGRFYHESYGLIRARYVQFTNLAALPPGVPFGFDVDQSGFAWRVTNDIARSREDLVLGLGASYTAPTDDTFGWVIVDGTNIQSIQSQTKATRWSHLGWFNGGILHTREIGPTIAQLFTDDELVEDDPDFFIVPIGALRIQYVNLGNDGTGFDPSVIQTQLTALGEQVAEVLAGFGTLDQTTLTRLAEFDRTVLLAQRRIEALAGQQVSAGTEIQDTLQILANFRSAVAVAASNAEAAAQRSAADVVVTNRYQRSASVSSNEAGIFAETSTAMANEATLQRNEAGLSAAAAALSESNASVSETNAGASAAAALTSETNAATSAGVAAFEASDAAASASSAATAASQASTSETNAAGSAATASTAATTATNAATTATTQAGIATTQATAASTSATASAASATSAAGAASTATTQAGIATSAATTATTQAGIATTQAANAATSATASAASATSASGSASTATTQAGIATSAASTATTQAGVATTQAATATTQATAAAASATGAAASASTATTQASNSSVSAGNSASSASASAASATSASASAASASASMLLAANLANNSLNANPVYADYASTPAIPGGWSDWVSGATCVRGSGGRYGSPYYCQMSCTAGSNKGILQTVNGLGSGYYVLEAMIELVSGNISGAGMYFTAYDSSNNVLMVWYFQFANETTIDGRTIGSTAGVYQFSKLVSALNVNTTKITIYMIGNYTGEGFGDATKVLKWYQASLRPASAEEVRSGVATKATVATLATAMVDGSGNAIASFEIVTAAGAASAAVRIGSRTGGSLDSTIALEAQEIQMWDATTRALALRIAGAKAQFTGDLDVGGSIRVGSRRIPVALQSFQVRAADGETVSFGADLVNIPILLFDTGGLAAKTAAQTYDVRATGLSSTGFTQVAKILTPGTTASVSSTGGTNVGGTPAWQIQKSDSADAYDGMYTFQATGSVVFSGGEPGFYEGRFEYDCYIRPSGGSWTYVGTISRNYTNSTQTTLSKTLSGVIGFGDTVGQHGSNTEFGVHQVESTITAFNSVVYTKQSTSGVSSATPSGEKVTITVIPQNV